MEQASKTTKKKPLSPSSTAVTSATSKAKAAPESPKPRRVKPKVAESATPQTVQENTTIPTEAKEKDEIVVVKGQKAKAAKSLQEPQSDKPQLFGMFISTKKESFMLYISAHSYNEALAKYYATEDKKYKATMSSVSRMDIDGNKFIA